MADKETVTVEAVRYHTRVNHNQEYQIGDRYEVDESEVGNLEVCLMAKRVPPDAPKSKKK